MSALYRFHVAGLWTASRQPFSWSFLPRTLLSFVSSGRPSDATFTLVLGRSMMNWAMRLMVHVMISAAFAL